MSALAKQLRDKINQSGPLSVSDYITTCLLDEAHGYYRTKKAIGADGDFITAPEISQVFGEMVAAFMAHIHQLFALEDDIICFEAGPGKGTLAFDMHNAYRQLSPAMAQAPLYMFEDSPAMQALQKDKLAPKACHHIDALSALPDKALFGVANEFFDALGVDQAQFHQSDWHHRLVGLKDDEFTYVIGARLSDEERAAFAIPAQAEEGDIIEMSTLSETIMAQLAHHIAHYGGALLLIDYGKTDNEGDTLQAVKDHQPCDVLCHQGEADITHWVDFKALANIAEANHARLIGPVPQGRFLLELGIADRAESLRQSDNPDQDRALLAAIDRLVSPAQMGQAFKVALLVPQGEGLPPGFASLANM